MYHHTEILETAHDQCLYYISAVYKLLDAYPKGEGVVLLDKAPITLQELEGCPDLLITSLSLSYSLTIQGYDLLLR